MTKTSKRGKVHHMPLKRVEVIIPLKLRAARTRLSVNTEVETSWILKLNVVVIEKPRALQLRLIAQMIYFAVKRLMKLFS